MISVQNNTAPELCLDIPRLLGDFEGLGDNCDFGVVQRAVGIEPFGLFRFAGCEARDLGALLRARFHPLGEPEDLWLEEVGPRREYRAKSHHCSFSGHTDRYAGQDDPAVVRTAHIEKTRYLKAKLLHNLSSARRLFVFKGPSDMATMQGIAGELRTYGPNSLLWVCQADAAQRPGSVERLEEGLLRGFVSRYGTYDEAPSLPVEEWVAVCAHAYRLWRNADPYLAPVSNLISQAIAAGSCDWYAHVSATTRVLDEPAPAGSTLFEHRLGRSEPTSVYRAFLPIAAGGDYVFSTWIRIAEGFRGRQIGAVLAGFPSAAMWLADLKSHARWQRVWVTATLPSEARHIACDILVEGDVGGVFQSGSWCLERGTRPLGYGVALSGASARV